MSRPIGSSLHPPPEGHKPAWYWEPALSDIKARCLASAWMNPNWSYRHGYPSWPLKQAPAGKTHRIHARRNIGQLGLLRPGIWGHDPDGESRRFPCLPGMKGYCSTLYIPVGRLRNDRSHPERVLQKTSYDPFLAHREDSRHYLQKNIKASWLNSTADFGRTTAS